VKRREFISLIGGTAAAWPFAARAQQADQVPAIGMLIGYPEDDPETRPVSRRSGRGLGSLVG
jgi:putative tryptophan/tyrosine transport system substrate-binding protein